MNEPRPQMPRAPKVMWLLNHATLRQFEMRQLEALGVREIYLPKRFPFDEGNLSANIDSSRDASLTLSRDELEILNAQDWYATPSTEAWEIANRHFEVLFFAFFPRQIQSVTRNFAGDAILRVFGHARGYTYSGLMYQHLGIPGVERIMRMGDRFWFGQAYEHLHEIEADFVKRRRCYLPIGLKHATVVDEWRGDDARLYFVCPRIRSSGHFATVYAKFAGDFKNIPFAVGGAQPIAVDDPRVLGYVPAAEHEENMKRFRVMYYHSTEPNHVHYHPFEAVRAGMPLVFMAGGMLDRLGGVGLPGRCENLKEARRKIERILANDRDLIDAIRASQPRLLQAMRPEASEPLWRENFDHVLATRARRRPRTIKRAIPPKVAVIVPSMERPAVLLHAHRVAAAIERGSAAAGERASVVLAVVERPGTEQLMRELNCGHIKRRTFRWTRVTADTARLAARFAGHVVDLRVPEYIATDDGINHLLDCDAWVFSSDNLSSAVLPLRPGIVISCGFPTRYGFGNRPDDDAPYVRAAQRAEQVWTHSRHAYDDVSQYAGVPPERIRRMDLPQNDPVRPFAQRENRFALVLDGAGESLQQQALDLLSAYYERCGGDFHCTIVTGQPPGAQDPLDLLAPSLRGLADKDWFRSSVSWASGCSYADRAELFAGIRFMVMPQPSDDQTCYAADALHSGVDIVVDEGPAWREAAELYQDRVHAIDMLSPTAGARVMRALDPGAPSGAQPVVDSIGLRRLDLEYWRAVREWL